MKVRVDRFKCLGLGNCVDFAPTVFALDKEHKAMVIDQKLVNDQTLLQAVQKELVQCLSVKS